MKELGEKIHRSKATMTVLVDKLVNLDYVSKEKDSKDCRVTWIRIAKKGAELEPIFVEISKAMNAVVYQGLEEEAAQTLERNLKSSIVNLSKVVR